MIDLHIYMNLSMTFAHIFVLQGIVSTMKLQLQSQCNCNYISIDMQLHLPSLVCKGAQCFGQVQVTRKKYVFIAKQDPGRARQNS